MSIVGGFVLTEEVITQCAPLVNLCEQDGISDREASAVLYNLSWVRPLLYEQ